MNTILKITKRSFRFGGGIIGIKEHGTEKIAVMTLHNSCIKLTQSDKGVKSFDRNSGPRGMIAVRK